MSVYIPASGLTTRGVWAWAATRGGEEEGVLGGWEGSEASAELNGLLQTGEANWVIFQLLPCMSPVTLGGVCVCVRVRVCVSGWCGGWFVRTVGAVTVVAK